MAWSKVRGQTHSRQSGWWFFWSGCWGRCSAPSRHSRQCACGGSWWWWTVARSRPGSCCRTRRTDWPGWTGLDTVKKQSLSPGLSILALLCCTESRLSEECLGQLKREDTETLMVWRTPHTAEQHCVTLFRTQIQSETPSVDAQQFSHTHKKLYCIVSKSLFTHLELCFGPSDEYKSSIHFFFTLFLVSNLSF